ncbi:MAG: TolC family protein [Myxococcales bacterium]|nr:TolC family protein [Myxococcales bacterium]
MRRLRKLLVALPALCLPGCYQPAAPLPTWSAPPPLAQAPGGCEPLVQAVLARHPALEAARRGEAVARAEAQVGLPSPFPALRVRDNVRSPGDDLRVGLRWALPRPGVTDAAEAAGEAGVALTQAELRLIEAEVAATVRQAHLDWRRARLVLAAAERAAARRQAEQTFVERKQAAGLASAVASTRAALATSVARAEVAEARAALAAATDVLRLYAGEGLPGDAPCAPPSGGAVDDHPQVQAAQALAAQQQAQAEGDRREGWAWPGYFELLYDREPDQSDRVLAGLSFELGKPFEADRTRAVRDREVARLAAARRAVADGVARARARLSAAQAGAAELPDGRSAGALLDEATRGGADPAERLALQQALEELALRRALAGVAAEAARIDLAAALGRP